MRPLQMQVLLFSDIDYLALIRIPASALGCPAGLLDTPPLVYGAVSQLRVAEYSPRSGHTAFSLDPPPCAPAKQDCSLVTAPTHSVPAQSPTGPQMVCMPWILAPVHGSYVRWQYGLSRPALHGPLVETYEVDVYT